MNLMSKFVVVVNGPSSIGKSTVGKELAKIISKKVAFVERDVLRWFVVNYSVKAQKEFDLANKNLCCIVDNFLANGYNVIISGVFDKKEHLTDLCEVSKKNDAKFLFITLDAPLGVVMKRYSLRGRIIPFGRKRVKYLYNLCKKQKEKGIIVDATLPISKSVRTIQKLLKE